MPKKCFEDAVGFNDRWIVLAGLPIASLLTSLLLFNDLYAAGAWRILTACILMSFVYTGAFWYALRWVYHRVKLRYPASKDIAKRLLLLFGAFVVVFVSVDFLLGTLFEQLFHLHDRLPNPIVKFISSLLLSALVITIYEAFSFYLQLQRTIGEKVDLERKNVESQLESLRNQVNPHFLFNSLNTLIYLIPEDSQKAVRFVQQLSKVYRYVLESREAKIIPLRDELEFLDSYVFLLKERFGENFQVQLRNLEDRDHMAVVPLALQMLFENAIKHNVISTEKPLQIELFADDRHLIVRNNLQRKNQVMDSTGIGLENIKTRYRMLTEQEVEVIVSQQYFTVLLPLIPIDQTAMA